MQDDIPVFVSADAGVVAGNSALPTVTTGDLNFLIGADETGSLKFTAQTAPTDLVSNGKLVAYSISGDGHTLTGYVETNGIPGYQDVVDTHVFEAVLNPSMNGYTFTLYQPLQSLVEVEVGGSAAFGASPTAFQVLTDKAVAPATPVAELIGYTTSNFNFDAWKTG